MTYLTMRLVITARCMLGNIDLPGISGRSLYFWRSSCRLQAILRCWTHSKLGKVSKCTARSALARKESAGPVNWLTLSIPYVTYCMSICVSAVARLVALLCQQLKNCSTCSRQCSRQCSSQRDKTHRAGSNTLKAIHYFPLERKCGIFNNKRFL